MQRRELFPYQREIVDRAIAQRRLAICAEQGTGKTIILIGVIERLLDDRFSALLVVPLANLETTWLRSLGEELPQLSVATSWSDYRALSSPRALIMNYESFVRVVKKLRTHPWTLVAFDEAHKLKARGSKASRSAKRLTGGEYRLTLTGTPIEQQPQDLWAQMRFLAPDVLGERWADFDAEWLRPTGFMGYKREFKPEKLQKFIDLVSPLIARVTKAQVLDLTPIKFVSMPVDLLGEQRRVYRAIERDMTVVVQGREVICPLAITQQVRLQQAAGGFLRCEDGSVVKFGNAKRRRLRSLASRLRRPFVVFTKYKEELEDAVAALEGLKVGVVSGDTRDTRPETVDAFQAGELDALVCQIRAGGVGLNLHRACEAVVYSTTFSSIDFDQAVSRLHRYGQTEPVTIYLIPARDTVDTTIELVVAIKRKVARRVLDDHTNRRTTMAKKEEKKAEAKAPRKPPTPPKIERPKYGVPELAEALGIKPASVRVQLRNAEIEKSGKLYGWSSKSEMQEVIDRLKAAKPAKAAPKAKKSKSKSEDVDDEDEVEADDEDGDDEDN